MTEIAGACDPLGDLTTMEVVDLTHMLKRCSVIKDVREDWRADVQATRKRLVENRPKVARPIKPVVPDVSPRVKARTVVMTLDKRFEVCSSFSTLDVSIYKHSKWGDLAALFTHYRILEVEVTLIPLDSARDKNSCMYSAISSLEWQGSAADLRILPTCGRNGQVHVRRFVPICNATDELGWIYFWPDFDSISCVKWSGLTLSPDFSGEWVVTICSTFEFKDSIGLM